MAAKGATVWVSLKTRERLRNIERAIVAQVEAGTRGDFNIDPEPINPQGSGLSMDQVINYLIDQLEAHRTRAKEQRQRRKKGRE